MKNPPAVTTLGLLKETLAKHQAKPTRRTGEVVLRAYTLLLDEGGSGAQLNASELKSLQDLTN